ncbi:MAG: phage major tail protein, TP901-1 family [Parvularcula sp.]
MTLSPGQDLLVSLDDGAGGFVAVAGLRTRSINLRSTLAESTNASSGTWRELLSGGGLRQATISGTGLFLNDLAADLARDAFFSEQNAIWQLDLPQSGRMIGAFHLANLQFGGVSDAEATMSLTLTSAGPLVFERTVP